MTVDRRRRDEVAEAQVSFEFLEVDGAVPRRAGLKCLDFAAEVERAVEHRVEERLLAQAIACNEEVARLLIVDGEREHPLEHVDTGRPILFVGVQDGFGIRT